jgi:hypothetical protein
LLSPEYLASKYCTAEWVNAMAGDPLNHGGRLILFRVQECAPEGMLKGLAYWDLLRLRDNPALLKEIVLAVAKPGRKKTATDAAAAYFRPAKTVLHDRIREVPNFTGRREDLAALDAALWTNNAAVITQAAVQGLGGVGKSTLAIQYAWENRARYAGAWWLGADTPAGAVDGLVALGAQFIPGLAEMENRYEAAKTALALVNEGGEKPWLLIYDNVEEPHALDGLTRRAGAQLLITTRWPDWTGRVVDLPLGVFAEEEAVAFLQERAGRSDADGARRLAADLGRLPLALDHAAAYCKRTGMAFDTYRALLPELIKRVLKGADYPRSVSATFSLAIEHAAEACPEAETLMGLFAWFAPDDIPLDLIGAEIMSEAARADAVAALCEVSLLEVGYDAGATLVSVHRLAQTVMGDRLAERGEAEATAAQALALVADAFPAGDDDRNPSDVRSWPACTALRPRGPRRRASPVIATRHPVIASGAKQSRVADDAMDRHGAFRASR